MPCCRTHVCSICANTTVCDTLELSHFPVGVAGVWGEVGCVFRGDFDGVFPVVSEVVGVQDFFPAGEEVGCGGLVEWVGGVVGWGLCLGVWVEVCSVGCAGEVDVCSLVLVHVVRF